MRLLRSCTVPPLSIKCPPTITALSLIAVGKKVLRLVIVPLLYTNAVPVAAEPAIWPVLFIDRASTFARSPMLPTLPRSATVPLLHSTRSPLPFASAQMPAIWPMLLIARASQPEAAKLLGSGRLVIVPLLYRKGRKPELIPHEPTTWPESLIPYAMLYDPASGASAPRSMVFFPVHRAASTPVLVLAAPATWPDRLTAF